MKPYVTVHQECADCGEPYLPFLVDTCWDVEVSERCESCSDNANEAAYERSLSAYYGGSGPQSIREQYEAAWEQKRELDR